MNVAPTRRGGVLTCRTALLFGSATACRSYLLRDYRMTDPFFLLLLFGIPMISQIVSSQMRKRFVEYSSEPMPLSGRQAAMTYVVAALGAIIQALYFAKFFLGRGRR